MRKKLLLIFILCLFLQGNAYSYDFINITPMNNFNTYKDNVFEGDNVDFKIIESISGFKKGDIITGVIMNYKPNGFGADEAAMIISNFRTKDGNPIKGTIYLNGSEHPVLKDYCDRYVASPIWLIRGGEIHTTTDKNVFTLIME